MEVYRQLPDEVLSNLMHPWVQTLVLGEVQFGSESQESHHPIVQQYVSNRDQKEMQDKA